MSTADPKPEFQLGPEHLVALQAMINRDLEPMRWSTELITVPRRPRLDDIQVLIAKRPNGTRDSLALWIERNHARTGYVVLSEMPSIEEGRTLDHVDVNNARERFVQDIRRKHISTPVRCDAIAQALRLALEAGGVKVDQMQANYLFGAVQLRVTLPDDWHTYRILVATAEAPIHIGRENKVPIDEHFIHQLVDLGATTTAPAVAAE